MGPEACRRNSEWLANHLVMLYFQNTQGMWKKRCNSKPLQEEKNPTFSTLICHVEDSKNTMRRLCNTTADFPNPIVFNIHEHFTYIYRSAVTHLLHTDNRGKRPFTLLLWTLLLKTSWYSQQTPCSLQADVRSCS